MKGNKSIGIGLGALVLLGSALTAVAATWAPPTDVPPGNNAEAPITISATGQNKAGGLGLNTSKADTGLFVYSGKVIFPGSFNGNSALHPLNTIFNDSNGFNNIRGITVFDAESRMKVLTFPSITVTNGSQQSFIPDSNPSGYLYAPNQIMSTLWATNSICLGPSPDQVCITSWPSGAGGTQGAKGDTGAQGPKGDKGDKGDAGAAATASFPACITYTFYRPQTGFRSKANNWFIAGCADGAQAATYPRLMTFGVSCDNSAGAFTYAWEPGASAVGPSVVHSINKDVNPDAYIADTLGSEQVAMSCRTNEAGNNRSQLTIKCCKP